MKQALILAGGKGTRLRERLADLPKPLIDICGHPLLERQIQLLKQHGFERVLILVNYRAEVIAQFCAENKNFGIEIQCIDDGEPRGTAGSVLAILDHLDEEFLVMYGDTMLQVDLVKLKDFHTRHPDVAATLFLHPNDHPQDSDLVEINEAGLVLDFHPYPHPAETWLPNLVNAGLYCIRRDALLPWKDQPGLFDFGKDLFPAMMARGLHILGYNSPEYIKDIGTPSRLDKVSEDFRSGRIERARLDNKQMAVFLDRDGTINREVGHLTSAEDFELLPGVDQAILRLNRSEYRVCVITNQPVVARGECSLNELRRIHNKMETLIGRAGAYIDRISYCPHHPDAGFSGEVPELKFPCNCRKPNTGMIDDAITSLNIDPSFSWLIGDSSADMLAAERSGLRSILVETGYGGLDHKYFSEPHYVVPNLPAAVEFILDGHSLLLNALRPLAAGIQSGELVFIGGHSRAGKSTVASALRELLVKRGQSCHVLCTDRWLHSASQRGAGVEGRHDMASLHTLVSRLSTRSVPIPEVLPGYAKARREQVLGVQRLVIHPSDIVIIEGVVALALDGGVTGAHRILVTVNEQARKQRLLRQYELRGEGVAAEDIYLARMQDEWPWIEANASGAIPFEIPSFRNEKENV